MSTTASKIVSGYIHKFYGYLIASDIIKLCVLFFDEELICIFKEAELKQLLLMKGGGCFHSEDIKYNDDLTLLWLFAPNGITLNHLNGRCTGYLQSCLSIKFIGDNVKHCTVSFTLYCDEFEAEHRALKRYTHTKGTAGFLCDIKLSECDKLNQLTFRCIVHSVTIQYNKQCNYKKIHYPSTPMVTFKQCLAFQWDVNGALLEKFKNCVCGQRYNSANFGNFCLNIAPNGTHERLKGSVEIILKLLKWPQEIKKMNIRCKIKSNYDKEEIVYVRELDVERKRKTIHCNRNSFNRNQLTDKLMFDIHIEICELYHENNHQIECENWGKYGVINTVLSNSRSDEKLIHRLAEKEIVDKSQESDDFRQKPDYDIDLGSVTTH